MWAFVLPFPLAAIHLVEATDSRIEGVSVIGWHSDGISLQRGANDIVRNCLTENAPAKDSTPAAVCTTACSPTTYHAITTTTVSISAPTLRSSW